MVEVMFSIVQTQYHTNLTLVICRLALVDFGWFLVFGYVNEDGSNDNYVGVDENDKEFHESRCAHINKSVENGRGTLQLK